MFNFLRCAFMLLALLLAAPASAQTRVVVGLPALLASVAAAWIAEGAMFGRAAVRHGWGGAVPRFGAAAFGSFAMLLLVGPLLR